MLFVKGEARTRVEAFVKEIGQDLQVSIYGGEKPHIGAVAVAACSQDINNSFKKIATASVITLQGHMEDSIAKNKATELSVHTGKTVAVLCGIHTDNISKKEIEDIILNVDLIIEQIKNKIV